MDRNISQPCNISISFARGLCKEVVLPIASTWGTSDGVLDVIHTSVMEFPWGSFACGSCPVKIIIAGLSDTTVRSRRPISFEVTCGCHIWRKEEPKVTLSNYCTWRQSTDQWNRISHWVTGVSPGSVAPPSKATVETGEVTKGVSIMIDRIIMALYAIYDGKK